MSLTARPAPGTRAERLPIRARRHGLVAEVRRALDRRCAVPPGSTVLVGASGGADSTALLLALVVLRDRRRAGGPLVEPVAAHVHHHLRDDADADAEIVTALCTRLDLPCRIEHVRPGELPGNIAANARRLRYAALARLARAVAAPYVAVAHHGEDQLETILMALCRGTGLGGLSGMSWTRPLEGDLHLVRPLLASRRAQCRDLCVTAEVSWCEDPTNADPATARGRLRREVIPVLEALWPDVPRRITAAADAVGAAAHLVEQEVARVFGPAEQRRWPRPVLAGLPPAVVAAGLRRAAMATGEGRAPEPGQGRLIETAEAIRDGDERPRRFAWPGDLEVHVTARQVELREAVPRAER